MEWLNYHHLLYFWRITQEGSLTAAAASLRVSHSTLSAQLKQLEGFMGAELFERRGRRLVLTPFGHRVAGYASDIFRTGGELVEFARGRGGTRRAPFRVGVVGNLPRAVIQRLIQPALKLPGLRPLQIQQQPLQPLLEALAAGRLDLVLSDAPPADSLYRVHAHLLGSTGIVLYGSRALAAMHGAGFPGSLDGAPVLLPSRGGLRRALDLWFTERGLRVRVEGEFDDAGLLRSFGGAGLGLFPVRAMLQTEVEEAHGARPLGVLEGVQERFYALSIERRLRDPGLAAIVNEARASLAEVTARR